PYHYRVVASRSGGTVTSSDQTFTTPAAPGAAQQGGAAAPKLTLASVHKPLSLTSVLKHGLRYRFSCSQACTVSFTLTFQLPARLQRIATAVILAKGTARLSSAGKGVVVLRFNTSGRRALAHKRT